MFSGRYRTEQLCRFWSENRNGFCLAPSCIGQEQEEDLFHLLASCPSWHEARVLLGSFTVKYSQNVYPRVQSIALALTNPSHPSFVQFILDCSTLPNVIEATQTLGPDVLFHLFHISRTRCYTLHRERLKAFGRWRKF